MFPEGLPVQLGELECLVVVVEEAEGVLAGEEGSPSSIWKYTRAVSILLFWLEYLEEHWLKYLELFESISPKERTIFWQKYGAS